MHGHNSRAGRRALTTMIVPFMIVVGFAIVGALVASIALNPQNAHALVKSGLCGNMWTRTYAGANGHLQQTKYYLESNSTISAQTYAQDCHAQQG